MEERRGEGLGCRSWMILSAEAISPKSDHLDNVMFENAVVASSPFIVQRNR